MTMMTPIIAAPPEPRGEAYPVARRALLAGAVLLPLGGFAALTAQAAPGAALLAEWRAAMLAIETASHDTTDAEYSRLMTIEKAIINGGHTGPLAAEAALWIALTYDANTEAESMAIITGDVEALRGLRDKPNWQQQAIYAALLAIRGKRP